MRSVTALQLGGGLMQIFLCAPDKEKSVANEQRTCFGVAQSLRLMRVSLRHDFWCRAVWRGVIPALELSN